MAKTPRLNTIPQTKTTDYTLAFSDSTVLFDCTSGNRNATLPDASTMVGKQFTIKKFDSTSGFIQILFTSNQNADGRSGTATTIRSQNEFFTFQATTTGWTIVASNEFVSASYSCSVNKSSSTATAIDFDVKEYDTHSAVTGNGSAAWKFTAPSPGTYQVSIFTAEISGTTNTIIYKNASAYKQISFQGGASSIPGVGSTTVKLLATEFFDIRAVSALTVTGGALNSSTSIISISRIGP